MLMYILMFLAAIKLRISQPHVHRVFRIPGGLFGLMFVALIGLLGTLVTLVVSFMPPNGIDVGSLIHYELTLIIGLLLMCSPPFIANYWQKRHA